MTTAPGPPGTAAAGRAPPEPAVARRPGLAGTPPAARRAAGRRGAARRAAAVARPAPRERPAAVAPRVRRAARAARPRRRERVERAARPAARAAPSAARARAALRPARAARQRDAVAMVATAVPVEPPPVPVVEAAVRAAPRAGAPAAARRARPARAPAAPGATAAARSGGAGGGMPSAGCTKTRTLQDGNRTITSGGMSRMYYLKTPSNYDNEHPYRLIFTFHWFYGSINAVVNPPDADHNTDRPFYGLSDLSGDTTIFVAPQGLTDSGGAGWANPSDRDVKFTDDMLAAITADLCIDTSRVFTTGFSYGGSMSYELACTRPDKFRAALLYEARHAERHQPRERLQDPDRDLPVARVRRPDAQLQPGAGHLQRLHQTERVHRDDAGRAADERAQLRLVRRVARPGTRRASAPSAAAKTTPTTPASRATIQRRRIPGRPPAGCRWRPGTSSRSSEPLRAAKVDVVEVHGAGEALAAEVGVSAGIRGWPGAPRYDLAPWRRAGGSNPLCRPRRLTLYGLAALTLCGRSHEALR